MSIVAYLEAANKDVPAKFIVAQAATKEAAT
jgi:hypothetical protein